LIESRSSERRRAPRVNVDFPLEFSHPFPREVIRVKNISTSGICCISQFPLPEMTRVGIIINLPEPPMRDRPMEPIKCEGAVVRCEPQPVSGETEAYELAIFLTDISPVSMEELQRFVNSRLIRRGDLRP